MPSFQSTVLTALLFGSAIAVTPDNVSSRLQIHVPQSLFRENGYDHREALFGIPPYGGSIAQNLYYADSDLCDPTVDSRIGYPTREKDESGLQASWPTPFILLVDRGGCSFVQKVRNAQHAGASGVVIADNKCLCNDEECMETFKVDVRDCQNAEPIMADDGSGGDIFIPSFLMFMQDAETIKSEVKLDHMVQIEMQWALPTPDDRVEYDLWTVPSDNVSKEFQKSWGEVAKKLEKHVYFTPHQYIYDGVKSHCQGNDGKNMCFNLCTNNGRYCATDPDSDLEHGISGADVVRESLRRICIWKHYGESDGIGEKYWNYITQFLDRCNTPDFFASKECTNDAMKLAKVDQEDISRCINDSGGTESDSGNTLLDLEMAAQTRRGVVILPTVFVNTVALRGALSVESVFNAVCAGFLQGTQPAICNTCTGCRDVVGCAKKGVCTAKAAGTYDDSIGGGSVSKRTFGVSLLVICGIFGAAGYLHWKKTREEMRDQVRGILAEYMPLEDGGDSPDDSPMDFARKGGTTSLIS